MSSFPDEMSSRNWRGEQSSHQPLSDVVEVILIGVSSGSVVRLSSKGSGVGGRILLWRLQLKISISCVWLFCHLHVKPLGISKPIDLSSSYLEGT